MASGLGHPVKRELLSREHYSFAPTAHERFATMAVDELNACIQEVASKSLFPYRALTMPFWRLSAEQRGGLALVLAERAPRALIERLHDLKIEDRAVLWQIAQKIARMHPSALIVGLTSFAFDAAQRLELFKKVVNYELSYITYFAKFELPEEICMQTALEIALADPERLAKGIARLYLREKARLALMQAVLRANPVVFVVHFAEFGFRKDAAWAARWFEIGLVLPPEAYTPYYRQIQEAVTKTDLPKWSDKEIVIGGTVMSDGLGDYMNLLALTKAIHRQVPGQKMRLILKVDLEHFEETAHVLSPPDWLSLDVMFSNIGDLPPPALTRVLSSSLTAVLEPVGGGDFPHIKEKMHLLEPGGGEGLGLRDEDYGLLLPDLSEVPSSAAAISCTEIKELVEASLHAGDMLGVLYFNDLEDDAIPLALKTIELAAHLTDEERNMTYLTNLTIDDYALQPLTEPYAIIETVSKKGIKKIVFEREGKRRLTLVTTALIPHRDMLIIQKLSNSPLIGCTGDQSFAEALASVKERELFIYQVRVHKREIANQYFFLAKQLLPKGDPYLFFLEQYESLEAKDLIKEVDFTRCFTSATHVNGYIRTHKNASLIIPEIMAARMIAEKL